MTAATRDWSRTWTSAASAIYEAVRYTDKSFSLVDVMGYTGHAFRLNMIRRK
jgi:hypothetical protein